MTTFKKGDILILSERGEGVYMGGAKELLESAPIEVESDSEGLYVVIIYSAARSAASVHTRDFRLESSRSSEELQRTFMS